MPFCNRAFGGRLRSQTPGLAVWPGESHGPCRGLAAFPRPCLRTGRCGWARGSGASGFMARGAPGGRRRCLPRVPVRAGRSRPAAPGGKWAQAHRKSRPRRGLCLRCGQRKEQSACSGPAEPAARNGAEPCLTRYGRRRARPTADPGGSCCRRRGEARRRQVPQPQGRGRSCLHRPPPHPPRCRGAAPARLRALWGAARGEPGRDRPGGAGGTLPSRSVCVPISDLGQTLPPPSPSRILIPLFPPLGVLREEHGGGFRAGDTRGPGPASGRSGGGSAEPRPGSPPGQPCPWKRGSAARGEPCCTTVVSFHFLFPRWVVGCSFPGAGFVRVRLDLPGPLFALGMQKEGGKTPDFLNWALLACIKHPILHQDSVLPSPLVHRHVLVNSDFSTRDLNSYLYRKFLACLVWHVYSPFLTTIALGYVTCWWKVKTAFQF